MSLDIGAAKWGGRWNGVEEALEERDECSIDELKGETGLPDEVDVSRAIGCQPLVNDRESYEEAGVTALAMEIIELDNGKQVYLTNASLNPNDFQVHVEHEDRSMFGYYALKSLKKHVNLYSDINIPTHATVGRGWVVEGIDGTVLNEFDEDVEYDVKSDFRTTLAAHLLIGNKDAHSGNFILDGDGGIWGFDLDRAGYSLFRHAETPEYPEFPLEEEYDDMDEFESDRIEHDQRMGELQEEGWANEYLEPTEPTLEAEDAISKAENSMQKLAGMNASNGLWSQLKSLMGETFMRYDDEELDAIVDDVPDRYSEYKQNFRANLYAARDYDFPDFDGGGMMFA